MTRIYEILNSDTGEQLALLVIPPSSTLQPGKHGWELRDSLGSWRGTFMRVEVKDARELERGKGASA